LPGFDYYDESTKRDFPLHDIPILRMMLRSLGFGPLITETWARYRRAWETIAERRARDAQRRMALLLRVVLFGAWQADEARLRALPPLAVRQRMGVLIRPFLEQLPDVAADAPLSVAFEEAEACLDVVVRRMSAEPRFAAGLSTLADVVDSTYADVLIVTATDVETIAILTAFDGQPGRVRRIFVGDKTYFDLGRIRGARVVQTQSELGSGGPAGSTLTVMEGISAFNPTSVILAGIAFGVSSRAQRLGEILVSRQIFDYEVARAGTGPDGRLVLIARGDRPAASGRLLDRCHAALPDWIGPPVTFGVLLSGAKLVDNVDFRAAVIELAGGEAIGGEMEGGGCYASAHRRKVDWIVIKSISDWADGRKRQEKAGRQRQAARNSALFVHHLITRGGFARD
jgi:nucleoside phosphorylase